MKKLGFLLVGIALFGFTAGAEARPNYSDETTVSGTLVQRGDDFYVEGLELELGHDRMVAEDYDGDGVVETIENEMRGLVGKSIVIKGYRDVDFNRSYDPDRDLYVTEINGVNYPNPELRHR